MASPTDLGGPGSTGIHGKSFFEVIPRELRDAIYDLTFDHETMSNSFEIEFRAPLPHLRLVSRQFKQEYDEQSPRDATLVISNHSLWFQHHACQTPRFLILPQLATRCTAMHFTHHLHDEEVFPNRKSLVGFLDKHYSGFPQSIGERLSHLEKVHVQPIFNYVENFDLLCPRHQPESVFEYFLPWYDSATLAIPGATAILEPCHINLLLPNPLFPHLASRVKPKIASGGDFDDLTTLAMFHCRGGDDAQERVDLDLVTRRSYTEAEMLAGWKAHFGGSVFDSLVEGIKAAAEAEEAQTGVDG